MSAAPVRPPNCRRAELGEPVRLRVAARAQVDEPLVVAARRRRRATDHGRGVRDGELTAPDVGRVRAAAVCPRRPPGERDTVEVNLEQLVDPLARGRSDLQRDLGGITDHELEPGGYGTSHGR